MTINGHFPIQSIHFVLAIITCFAVNIVFSGSYHSIKDLAMFCLILFFMAHQQSFSYVGTGLPGLNQY